MESTIHFIEVVKSQEPIYDTTHQDYKNAEKKAKAWKYVSREVGLSVECCKRKWKNLRDSYTKYLRSFRTGTKTSRKYQYWAHAEHMDFLKPFQGPGRAKPNPIMDNIYENYSYMHLKDETDCSLNLDTPENLIASDLKDLRPISPNDPISNLPHAEKMAKKGRIQIETKDLDSTSLFFLSLAKSVRAMPRKQQAAIKMRCMKIVSDAEIDMENLSYTDTDTMEISHGNSSSWSSGQNPAPAQTSTTGDNYEHFLYVMSPSRVEAMIDLLSDDEQQTN